MAVGKVALQPLRYGEVRTKETSGSSSSEDDFAQLSANWNPCNLVPVRKLMVWTKQTKKSDETVKVRFSVQNNVYVGKKFAWKINLDENHYKVSPQFGILNPNRPQIITITCSPNIVDRMNKDWLEIMFKTTSFNHINNWDDYWKTGPKSSAKTESLIVGLKFVKDLGNQRFFESRAEKNSTPQNNTAIIPAKQTAKPIRGGAIKRGMLRNDLFSSEEELSTEEKQHKAAAKAKKKSAAYNRSKTSFCPVNPEQKGEVEKTAKKREAKKEVIKSKASSSFSSEEEEEIVTKLSPKETFKVVENNRVNAFLNPNKNLSDEDDDDKNNSWLEKIVTEIPPKAKRYQQEAMAEKNTKKKLKAAELKENPYNAFLNPARNYSDEEDDYSVEKAAAETSPKAIRNQHTAITEKNVKEKFKVAEKSENPYNAFLNPARNFSDEEDYEDAGEDEFVTKIPPKAIRQQPGVAEKNTKEKFKATEKNDNRYNAFLNPAKNFSDEEDDYSSRKVVPKRPRKQSPVPVKAIRTEQNNKFLSPARKASFDPDDNYDAYDANEAYSFIKSEDELPASKLKYGTKVKESKKSGKKLFARKDRSVKQKQQQQAPEEETSIRTNKAKSIKLGADVVFNKPAVRTSDRPSQKGKSTKANVQSKMANKAPQKNFASYLPTKTEKHPKAEEQRQKSEYPVEVGENQPPLEELDDEQSSYYSKPLVEQPEFPTRKKQRPQKSENLAPVEPVKKPSRKFFWQTKTSLKEIPVPVVETKKKNSDDSLSSIEFVLESDKNTTANQERKRRKKEQQQTSVKVEGSFKNTNSGRSNREGSSKGLNTGKHGKTAGMTRVPTSRKQKQSHMPKYSSSD